jgi:hypothetical protein
MIGSMSEEESWAPVKNMSRQISARRIAQVWDHHTGHDTTKGFGTKTREWQMDVVIMLSKVDDENDSATENSKSNSKKRDYAVLKLPRNSRPKLSSAVEIDSHSATACQEHQAKKPAAYRQALACW